jgi:hypothetical protein
MEERKRMGGWKMKLGSFMVAIGALIIGSSEVAPMPEMIPWIKFIGFIVGGVGTAFLAWGAGHKMEKNKSVVIQKKKVPYYVHPMSPEEFKLLEAFRSKKKVDPPEAAGIS